MTHSFKVGLAALFLSVLAACGGGSDASDHGEDIAATQSLTDAAVADLSIADVADQVVADGQTLSELLATVTSPETAEAVQPQIKAIVDNYQALSERVDNTGNLGFADMAVLASRAPEIAQTQEAVMQELTRIYRDHPEAADTLREALRDFNQP